MIQQLKGVKEGDQVFLFINGEKINITEHEDYVNDGIHDFPVPPLHSLGGDGYAMLYCDDSSEC